MKVTGLQLYLRSLQSAVAATDATSPIPAELESAAAGLQPFADLDLGQLAAFLRQADEYRRSGAIAVPPPLSPQAEKVQVALRKADALSARLGGADVIDPADFTTERDQARRDLEYSLAAFLQPLTLGVTLKADAKALKAALAAATARAAAARGRAVAVQFREALAGVADEATLNAPERQQKLSAITEPLEAADLKAAALEIGILQPPATKPALLSAIVERLTGIKPAAGMSRRSSRPAAMVDEAAVRLHAIRLKELLEKSLDPDALSESEVHAAIAELDKLSIPVLKAIAGEVGLQNVGRTKADILKRIRLKLTEARRARESIQV